MVGTAVPAGIVGTGHTSSHSNYSGHSSESSLRGQAGSYQETSAGMSTSSADAGVSVVSNRAEEVCGTKTFTLIEDRPVIRERVERIVEHRPVEKQVRGGRFFWGGGHIHATTLFRLQCLQIPTSWYIVSAAVVVTAEHIHFSKEHDGIATGHVGHCA
jgi:hypothetical protein